MITRTTDEMRELNAKMMESDSDEQESRFVYRVNKTTFVQRSRVRNDDPSEMKFRLANRNQSAYK